MQMRMVGVVSLVLGILPVARADKRVNGTGFTVGVPDGWDVTNATDEQVVVRRGGAAAVNMLMLPKAEASKFIQATTDTAKCQTASADLAKVFGFTDGKAALHGKTSCETTATIAGQKVLVVVTASGGAAFLALCVDADATDAWAACRAIAASMKPDPKAKAKAADVPSAVKLTKTKDGGTLVTAPQLELTVPKGWAASAGGGDVIFNATKGGVAISLTREKRPFQADTEANCKKLGEALASATKSEVDARIHKLALGNACVVAMWVGTKGGMQTLMHGPDKDLVRYSCQLDDVRDRAAMRECGGILATLAYK